VAGSDSGVRLRSRSASIHRRAALLTGRGGISCQWRCGGSGGRCGRAWSTLTSTPAIGRPPPNYKRGELGRPFRCRSCS